MITANIVLPVAPDPVDLVFAVAYGPDFAVADFSPVDFYTSVLF